MTARFNPGDRVVAISGWHGRVERDDGGTHVVVSFPSAGTGNVDRQFLLPLPRGVIPHPQEASSYVH